MTRTQFMLYTALFGATAIVPPTAQAGIPGDWDWDWKKDEKKCGDLKIEVDYIEEVARIEGYDRIPCDTSFGLRVAVDNA